MVSLSGDDADTTPTARTSGAALTSDRLGEAWPEVSTRLRRMLGSRGVDSSLIDDIVQEVAVRALDKRVPFTDPADLYRWAATTARRLHIDHLRSDGRTTYDDALLAVPDGVDVAHAAERRVALGHVLRAMAVMRPGERDAILDSLEDREARTSQALVRRHRARATLRKAVGGVLTALLGARLRLRELAPAVQHASAAMLIAPVVAAGAGALLPAGEKPAPPGAAFTGTTGGEVSRPAARAATKPAPAAEPAVRRGAERLRPASAPARPAAAPADPGGDAGRTRVGPVVHEPTDPPEDERLVCVENRQQPVWCAPTLSKVQPAPPPGR